jgi:hypothetical protein
LKYKDEVKIDTEKFINTLIKYDFRPDGIAYLLLLISELFFTGKTEGIKRTQTDINYKALDILSDLIKNKTLEEKKKLDEQKIEKNMLEN